MRSSVNLYGTTGLASGFTRQKSHPEEGGLLIIAELYFGDM